MNFQISIARGIVRLEKLEPGSLFVHRGTVAVKAKNNKHGACHCIVVGTGKVFYGNADTVEELNNLWVTPLLLQKR